MANGHYRTLNDLHDVYADKIGAYGVAIYGALLRRAQSKDTCHPSHADIAKLAGCSVNTVKRTLPALEEAGLIRTYRRVGPDGQTSNVYRLGLVHGLEPQTSTAVAVTVATTGKATKPGGGVPLSEVARMVNDAVANARRRWEADAVKDRPKPERAYTVEDWAGDYAYLSGRAEHWKPDPIDDAYPNIPAQLDETSWCGFSDQDRAKIASLDAAAD